MTDRHHTDLAAPLWFRLLPILPLVLAAGVGWYLWADGGMAQLSAWAAEGQRDVQNAMAGALRALRAGDPQAFSLLMGLCFLYGFFHAAGPGHGKILIGGYGMARQVGALRLSMLALVSSLAQSASAILAVLGGAALFGLTRDSVVGVTEAWFAPLSYAAIAGIGLWLAFRGVRRLWATFSARRHYHHHDDDCGCGHAHAPSAEQAAQIHNLRDGILLIGAIAIRPCTGALFLMLLCWRMDILGAGIAGTFAIGFGVASVTILVALGAVLLRQGALERVAGALPGTPRRTLALVEALAGTLVLLTAGTLLLRALPF